MTVDTVHELDRWTTADGGVTWDSIAITRGSLNKNMLPCVPRNHIPNMKVDCMWLNGVYTSMDASGYNCAVRIFPYKDGESLPTTAVQPVYQSTFAPRGMVCNRTGVTFFLDSSGKGFMQGVFAERQDGGRPDIAGANDECRPCHASLFGHARFQ